MTDCLFNFCNNALVLNLSSSMTYEKIDKHLQTYFINYILCRAVRKEIRYGNVYPDHQIN